MIAQKGTRVKVHYTGTLKSGEVFDSSRDRDPIEFVVGAGQMIQGFDEGIEGMSVGEEKTLTIPAKEAYGERSEEMLFAVSRGSLPEGYSPSVGDVLRVTTQDGGALNAFVSNVAEEEVTLDANHRLAGEELTFEVTLLEVS